MENKIIIGFVEKIRFPGTPGSGEIDARIDTGATKSAIDLNLCSELNLGPILGTKKIRSSHGTRLRPVIQADVEIKGIVIKGKFTIADRTEMYYPVLIGRNILRKGNFLIDPKIRTQKCIKPQ